MVSAMVFPIFLWVLAVHAAHGWPCNAENTFEAASYVKTEDELNGKHENLRAYFPPLNDLPSTVSDESVPLASIKYPGGESVHLDPDGQEVHLEIPVKVSAARRSHSYQRRIWTVDTTADRKGNEHTEPRYHWETAGCDGTGHVLALVVLKASFQLGSGSLTWLPLRVKDRRTWGECLWQLPELKNDDIFQRVADKLQAQMSTSWGQGPEKRQVIDLAFGALLFLNFSTPAIMVADDGARTLSGSVLACVQDSYKHLYAIKPWQRSLEKHCRNQLLFSTDESGKNRPVRLDPSSPVVFRWHGSPEVGIHIRNEFQEVVCKFSEGMASSTVSLTTTKHDKSTAKSGSSWVGYLPRFCQRVVQHFAPSWPDDVAQFPGLSQNQDFWLSIIDKNDQQQILLGKGRAPGQHTLVQATIKAGGQLRVVLSSFDKTVTWQINSGQTQRICSHGMSTELAQGRGAVRMSTQLFDAVVGVQAQHLKQYVSKTETSFRDAKLNYSLQVGDIQLRVQPLAANEAPSLDLSVANSSTTAHCDGRVKPLLSASLDHFHGSASLVGQKDNGHLLFSMAFQKSDKYTWQGLHLQNPNIPLSRSAAHSSAQYVLERLVPNINENLKSLALVLPSWIVQFIPCELKRNQVHGRCINMKWKQHGSSGHKSGYMELRQVSAQKGVNGAHFFAVPSPTSLTTAAQQKLHQLAQGHPRLAIVSVAVVWLVWVGLAWQKSPKYAASAIALSILLWCWDSHSPFGGFTIAALQGFGIPQQESVFSVATHMQESTDSGTAWTLFEWLIVPIWADLFNFCWMCFMKTGKPGEKDQIGYWCFSVVVIVSQFWLLVGVPMTLFLGRELGAEIDDYSAKSFPSSAMNLIEVAFGVGQSNITRTTGTIVSCSFTSMFVAFIGLYLIFFLLALPVGAFLGAVGFVAQYGAEGWCDRIANRIALCVLITELLSTAASLGPFIIAYQILRGNVQWWLALGLIGVLRPLFAIPWVYAKSDRLSPRGSAIVAGLVYAGVSLLGGVFLWQFFNSSLSAFSAQTPGEAAFVGRLSNFAFAMYLVNVWFVASSAYILLHDTVHAGRSSSKLVGRELERAASDKWLQSVLKCIEDKTKIPCIKKVLQGVQISQTGKTHWEMFKPWLVWFLEMDAVVSFLYHCCRVCQLGFETSFFNAEMGGLWLLSVWLFESDHQLKQDLKMVPKVVLDGTALTWWSAIPIFTVCCVASWMMLLYAQAGSQTGRLRRTADMCRMRVLQHASWWMRCLKPVGSPTESGDPRGALEEELLGRDEKAHRAISNFPRLCRIEPDLAQETQSWAGLDGWANCEVTEEEGEYRKEFLLFGLLHGLLGFLRNLLWRESFPHTWGILGSEVAQLYGLGQFHNYLVHNGWEISREHTALDQPFLTFDWYMSLSSALQIVVWILVAASLLCELRNRKEISQAFSFMAGSVAIASGLSVLVPNYARLTNFPEYFRGCGPEFDRFMDFAVSGVFGMMFAVPLGLQAFCILVTIPISAVRGLWLVLIRPNMPKNRTLHAGMWLVACLIPFVTVFPLLFFCQFTEDEWSQGIIYQFWLFPSLTIIAAGKSRGETWFYFGWLVVYCGLVASFMYRQSQIMKIDMQQVVKYFDLPYLWSAMHSDFCLTSVIITDLVCLVLGTEEGDEDSEDEEPTDETRAELEMSRTCVGVPRQSFLVTEQIRSLPGYRSDWDEQGLTMVSFDSEDSAQAAANHGLAEGTEETQGHLVLLSSLSRQMPSDQEVPPLGAAGVSEAA